MNRVIALGGASALMVLLFVHDFRALVEQGKKMWNLYPSAFLRAKDHEIGVRRKPGQLD